MRKFAFLSFIISLLLFVSGVLAATATTTVNITVASSMMTHCDGLSLQFPIERVSIPAGAGGPHSFTIQNATEPDPIILMYVSGTFDPYNPCANILGGIQIGNNSTSNHTFDPGTAYEIVALYNFVFTYGSFDIVMDGANIQSKAAPVQIQNEDPDGDGISGDRDNCPHDFNPDQEDGWGSAMGDLCDTDWYNFTGNGIAGFPQKDGTFNLHGNCTYMPDGDPRCPVIGSFDPAVFSPDMMPMHFETGDAGGMSVVVHYLHSNNGPAVYQVNVYSTNPPQPDTLVDDRLEFHVNGGSWRWHMRGGHSNYQGGTYGETGGTTSDGAGSGDSTFK